MTATTRWVAGSGGLTYADAGFTLASFNSLASGSGVVAGTAYANGTNLDQYGQVSGSFVPGATTVAGGYLSLYLLALNANGTTYGDGTASGATAPSSTWWVANCQVNAGITTSGVIYFDFGPVVLPPGNFVWAIWNNLGVALNAAAAAIVDHRFFDVNLNA